MKRTFSTLYQSNQKSKLRSRQSWKNNFCTNLDYMYCGWSGWFWEIAQPALCWKWLEHAGVIEWIYLCFLSYFLVFWFCSTLDWLQPVTLTKFNSTDVLWLSHVQILCLSIYAYTHTHMHIYLYTYKMCLHVFSDSSNSRLQFSLCGLGKNEQIVSIKIPLLHIKNGFTWYLLF